MPSPKEISDSLFSLPRLHDDGVPTASIAVLDNGKIESHILTSGPENTETVYQAASISKAICALAVAKLVDDGKLSYETKAVDHLDAELVDVMVGKDGRTMELMQHVTIKMLLSHTSGLSQHGFPGYGTDVVASPQDIVAGKLPSNTPRIRFDAFPGAQCSYSGGGYVLLQLMLENITGMDFAGLMQQTLLKPLGMTRSWYCATALPASETNFTRAHLTAQAPAEVQRGYNILPELAAAGLWTTPSDLLKAIAAIQTSLHNTAGGFLKQSTAKLMLAEVGSRPGIRAAGLGWWSSELGFGHGGDNEPGYNANVVGFHGASGNGIAIMTNSALGNATCVSQIMGAVMWAKGWGPDARGEGNDDKWMGLVPYPAPADVGVDEGWRAWEGKWEGGWEVVEGGDGGPALRFGDIAGMPLRPAAAPVRDLKGGKKEIWLVVEGLQIGVRLTWEDEGRGEEVVRLQMEADSTLKRER